MSTRQRLPTEPGPFISIDTLMAWCRSCAEDGYLLGMHAASAPSVARIRQQCRLLAVRTHGLVAWHNEQLDAAERCWRAGYATAADGPPPMR